MRSTVQRCALVIALAASVVGTVATALWVCRLGGDSATRVWIRFDAPPGTRPLTAISIIDGDDKLPLGDLAAGEEKSLQLSPAPDAQRQLTVSYTRDGEHMSWNSAPKPAGIGTEYWLTVTADGRIAARECQRPCATP